MSCCEAESGPLAAFWVVSMTGSCHYCGRQLEAEPTFSVTLRTGEGELTNHLCSEPCLVAYAVGTPIGGGARR